MKKFDMKKKAILLVLVLAVFATCFLTGASDESCNPPEYLKESGTTTLEGSISKSGKGSFIVQFNTLQVTRAYTIIVTGKDGKTTIPIAKKSEGAYLLKGGAYANMAEVSTDKNTLVIEAILEADSNYQLYIPGAPKGTYTVKIKLSESKIKKTKSNVGAEAAKPYQCVQSMVWLNMFPTETRRAGEPIVIGYINRFHIREFVEAVGNSKDKIDDTGHALAEAIWNTANLVMSFIPGADSMGKIMAAADYMSYVIGATSFKPEELYNDDRHAEVKDEINNNSKHKEWPDYNKTSEWAKMKHGLKITISLERAWWNGQYGDCFSYQVNVEEYPDDEIGKYEKGPVGYAGRFCALDDWNV